MPYKYSRELRVESRESKVICLVLCLFALMLLTGCASTEQARFYTLTPLSQQETNIQPEENVPTPTLGIGPIKLPDYLDQPQIVTRSGQNRLILAEFDRWAGTLEKAFSRVLSENLSILLSTDRLFSYPWPRSTPIDYQIELEVTRFDGGAKGNVFLVARWTVYKGRKKTIGVMRKSTIKIPVTDGGYEELVAGQSRALADLSREIAESINTLSK